jgi:hypothetical protein
MTENGTQFETLFNEALFSSANFQLIDVLNQAQIEQGGVNGTNPSKLVNSNCCGEIFFDNNFLRSLTDTLLSDIILMNNLDFLDGLFSFDIH